MTIAEKLAETHAYAINGKIVLYSEGMFWKAYQEAAYLFVTNIKQYQINKIYVKKVETDVFSLGFPKPSEAKILADISYENEDGKIIIKITDSRFDSEKYRSWKESVIVQPLPQKRPSGESLLVYKHAYDLLLQFYQVNRNVGREYKFSLSEKIKNDFQDVLLNIYFANEQKENCERLTSVRNAIRLLVSAKIKVRLLHDLKQITLKQFAALAEKESQLMTELRLWESKI